VYGRGMAIPGPGEPSPFLADIGKGRYLGTRAVVLQRFEAGSWRDVGRYRNAHEANVVLDGAIGDGSEPGTLRVVDAPPSAQARSLMIAGSAVLAIVAILVLLFWLA
jgi:hypothetical protein